MTTMSTKQYVSNGGGVCPNCESDQIEDEDLNIQEVEAKHGRFCLDCEFSWIDNYLLIGYSELKAPDSGEIKISRELTTLDRAEFSAMRERAEPHPPPPPNRTIREGSGETKESIERRREWRVAMDEWQAEFNRSLRNKG